MPEGDTVWLAARRLNDALGGQILLASDFRIPALATTDLRGRQIREVISRGKHLLMRIEPDLTIHSHFRMDGAWHLYRPDKRWAGPAHEIRVVLRTADWSAVGYRLPVLELVASAAEATVVGHLGPDVLGPDWDPDEAVRRLRTDGGRTIGEALLDQRNLAGVGNLYKSEALFLSGISPWTPTEHVAKLAGVVERARRLIDANKERAAQITTGDSRRGHETWVYGRSGQPCRRCATTILRRDQGPAGSDRVTFWCPNCQPGGSPAQDEASRNPRC